jgi:hypothetical protein
MNLAKWHIYVLICPTINTVRYVGFSTNVQKRYKLHLLGKDKTRCGNWIRHIKQLGYTPSLEIIEEGSGENWKEREQYWIAHYRQLVGNLLTNITPGGEGCSFKRTPEQCAKMGIWKGKTFSEAHRKAISEGNKGKHANAGGVWEKPGVRESISQKVKDIQKGNMRLRKLMLSRTPEEQYAIQTKGEPKRLETMRLKRLEREQNPIQGPRDLSKVPKKLLKAQQARDDWWKTQSKEERTARANRANEGKRLKQIERFNNVVKELSEGAEESQMAEALLSA